MAITKYTACSVREYGEGRICLHTERINNIYSGMGSANYSFWRNILEWTGKKYSKENVSVAFIDSFGINNLSFVYSLTPINVQFVNFYNLSLDEHKDFDIWYFVDVPNEVGLDIKSVITSYVNLGGGLIIESPTILNSYINILQGIENVYVQSPSPPFFDFAFWTESGKTHYSYNPQAKISFNVSIPQDNLSNRWTTLLNNIEPVVVNTEINNDTNNIVATGKGISEFGISYAAVMQKGLVILEQGSEIDESSSSSSTDMFSESSSISDISQETSSSILANKEWDFCSNIIAHYKLNDNAQNSIIWDDTNNLHHMGLLYGGGVPVNTNLRSVAGKVNAGIDFEDLGDGYIISNSSITQFNFTNGSNDLPFGVTCWMKPRITSQYVSLVHKAQVWSLVFNSSTKSVWFMIYDDNTGGTLSCNTANDIFDWDEWCHIMVDYSGSGSSAGMRIFVNGTQVNIAHSTISYTRMRDIDSNLYLGYNFSAGYESFQGVLDNVLIIDRIFTATEILELYNNGNGTEACYGVSQSSSSSTSSTSSSVNVLFSTSSSSSTSSTSSTSSSVAP